MLSQVFPLIKTAWNTMSAWLFNFMDTFGWAYFAGSIFVMLIVRNVIYPMMKAGVGAADGVQKNIPKDARWEEVE